MAKLASHNSWSYLKPKGAISRLFNVFGKCQTLSIEEQYNMGVRLFDLRVKVKMGRYYKIAHGMTTYDINVYELYCTLRWLNLRDNVIVRVLLENRFGNDSNADAFYMFCRDIKESFPNITFVGGHGAHGEDWWTYYYSFGQRPKIQEYHASVKCLGLGKLFRERYAEECNAYWVEQTKADKDSFVMLDFVEYCKSRK